MSHYCCRRCTQRYEYCKCTTTVKAKKGLDKTMQAIKLNTTKPITPDEAMQRRSDTIPPEVIKAVNELIITGLDSSGYSKILLKDVISRTKQLTSIEPHSSWWNFEPIFEEAGWSVQFVRAEYYESFSSYFIFKKAT